MKYFSEKLNRVFDTEKELKAEEAKLDSTQETSNNEDSRLKDVEKVKENSVSKAPSKKQLAAAVEDAETALKEAHANYDVAKQKVEELSKKYLEEVDAILNPAKDAVKKAEQNRYEAIRKFNESYGAYQVTYTGERAAQEMLRTIHDIDKIHRDIFRSFWF